MVNYLATNLGPGMNLPPAKPVTLPDGAGKDLVEMRCGVCHDLERVAVVKRDRRAWPVIVADQPTSGHQRNESERANAFALRVPTVRIENRLRHKDGSWRWLQWTMTEYDGLIYAAGRHVTAEKEAAAALERAQTADNRKGYRSLLSNSLIAMLISLIVPDCLTFHNRAEACRSSSRMPVRRDLVGDPKRHGAIELLREAA